MQIYNRDRELRMQPHTSDLRGEKVIKEFYFKIHCTCMDKKTKDKSASHNKCMSVLGT